MAKVKARKVVQTFKVSDQSKAIKRVQCPECPKTFKNKESLRKHRELYHCKDPKVAEERKERKKAQNVKHNNNKFFGSFLNNMKMKPCVKYDPKSDKSVDKMEATFMIRYEAQITKTLTIHLKYYSSWIFVVKKAAKKVGFLKYLELNFNNSKVLIHTYFGLSTTPGPCSVHSYDKLNDCSGVIALLDDESGEWIAYAMDGPIYEDGTTEENERDAFRAKWFWRISGKIRAKTIPPPNRIQFPSLNKNTNMKRTAAAGQDYDDAIADGQLAYRIGSSHQPIICPGQTVQIVLVIVASTITHSNNSSLG